MTGRLLRILLPLFVLLGLTGGALAARHPANIAVARSRVTPDGKIEFEMQFDVLAFVLSETPTTVLDPPMNALLDGPPDALAARLAEAKKRFEEGFQISADQESGKIDRFDFPTMVDIRQWLKDGATPRLPVMLHLNITAHLPEGAKRISYYFPEVLGTVVLTTEFPYHEPISEAVEPSNFSQTLTIPSAEEIATAKRSMTSRPEAAKPQKTESEAKAKAAIQHQYNAWSHAYMANDVPKLLSILTPAYTLKTAKGSLIKYSEYAVMLNLRKKRHSDTSRYQTEILRMTLQKNVAAIFSRETTTDSELNPKTGKRTTTSFQHDYIDVWMLRDGKWRLQSTVTQREQSLPTNPKTL